MGKHFIKRWSFAIIQPTCTEAGTACAKRIQIDASECLVPCEGIFADVKRLPPENITALNTAIFMERYKLYKRYLDLAEGILNMNTILLPLSIKL